VSTFGLLILAIVCLPLVGIVVGLGMSGRIPNKAALAALGVQAGLVFLLAVRYATLPGDHYYVDRSVCRTASSTQSLQLYGLFWTSVVAWAGSGFTAAGSGRLAPVKVGLVMCAYAAGIVSLFLIISFALCDPS
jgi:hypothetical protein